MPSRNGTTPGAASGGGAPALDAPDFDLPPDFWTDRSRYKLLSIRSPAGFDLSSLDGAKIDSAEVAALFGGVAAASASATTASASAAPLAKFGDGDAALCLAVGHKSESDGFRLLARSGRGAGGGGEKKRKRADDEDDESSDDKSDDEEEEEEDLAGNSMRPLPAPFDAHLNVSDPAGLFDIPNALDLAPGADQAQPAPASAGTEVRVAYSPVPQKKGLIRRWTMPGGRSGRVGATTTAAAKRDGTPKPRCEEASETDPLKSSSLVPKGEKKKRKAERKESPEHVVKKEKKSSIKKKKKKKGKHKSD